MASAVQQLQTFTHLVVRCGFWKDAAAASDNRIGSENECGRTTRPTCCYRIGFFAREPKGVGPRRLAFPNPLVDMRRYDRVRHDANLCEEGEATRAFARQHQQRAL